jgi:hypothetical protein
VSSGKPTPEQVLAAVQAELFLLRQRLIACRNGLCRETGTFPDDHTAAEAVAAPDARFPWLCGAEKRTTRRRPAQATRDDRRIA